jgi:hypothetical protein
VIQFSKSKSDVHAKKDGDFEEHHKQRLLTKGNDSFPDAVLKQD